MNTWDRFTFFLFFSFFFCHKVHLHASYLASPKFNLRYKNKNFSRIFFFEAFSLAEIQYKNLQCCEFMSYYRQCTTGTFLLCSIYMFIHLTLANLVCQNLLYQTISRLASVMGKKRLLILHSDSTSSSIWVNTAFPLNSYKQLDFFPLLKSAWIRALENLHGFSFLSFFFLKFLFPPAPRGLISTSLWFSGTVSHLVLSFQHLFFHCCGHSPSQGSESR